MNKFKNLMTVVNENKVRILTRTAIIGGSIVAVTLVSGLFKVVPTPEAVAAAEKVAKAVKKAAE